MQSDNNQQEQADLETYLLLILSDSALPTGGFVASSGLESFVQHGFISSSSSSEHPFTLLSFLRESLISYAHLNLHFFRRAHDIVWTFRNESDTSAKLVEQVVDQISKVDQELEEMLLNHVTRRASKAQGIALLTLYSRAFASLPTQGAADVDSRMTQLMEALKSATRSKKTVMQGHLPICFAVLCASLGLSLERSLHLHLFLQARAILSSAVRLNLVGPYASQRLLLTDVRPIVAEALAEWQKRSSIASSQENDSPSEDSGPATTWPLGEILAARHDQLHSRIFNS